MKFPCFFFSALCLRDFARCGCSHRRHPACNAGPGIRMLEAFRLSSDSSMTNRDCRVEPTAPSCLLPVTGCRALPCRAQLHCIHLPLIVSAPPASKWRCGAGPGGAGWGVMMNASHPTPVAQSVAPESGQECRLAGQSRTQ